nr:MAG TPA: hypothetical protein [Caudoviricetes sp.]
MSFHLITSFIGEILNRKKPVLLSIHIYNISIKGCKYTNFYFLKI